MKASSGLLPLLALLLAGCAGSLLESNAEAPEVYRLQGEALADRGERLPLALVVGRLRSSSSLETERIAVVQPDSRFDYYEGVRWSEPAPQMLQQQLVRALSADGRFATVVAVPSRVPVDLLLDVELRRFEAVLSSPGAAPMVRVELQVSLVDPRKGARLASFAVTGSATAAAPRRTAVVAAFEQATGEAVGAVVDQLRVAPLAPAP